MDAPEHTRYRKMVTAEFTTKRVQLLRPRITEIVDKQLAELTQGGPPADLLAAFALPVTLAVISELLGIPQHDHTFLHTRTRAMFGGAAVPPPSASPRRTSWTATSASTSVGSTPTQVMT
jgi:cytochrome P450